MLARSRLALHHSVYYYVHFYIANEWYPQHGYSVFPHPDRIQILEILWANASPMSSLCEPKLPRGQSIGVSTVHGQDLRNDTAP